MDVPWQPELTAETTLTQGATTVRVAAGRGALVTSLSVAGRELLYLDRATLDDPTTNVRGGIPILFPNAGPLPDQRFADRGTTLLQHGFARRFPWEIVEQRPDRLVAQLPDHPAIQARFPYPFVLTATFTALARGLRCALTVTNVGAEPLPIAPGWHPYLAVPHAAKTGIVSTFLGPTWSRIHDASEFVFAVPFTGPCDLTLPPDGQRVTISASPEIALLQQWSLPGQDFVCFEPFLGPNGTLNDPARRLNIPPGATRTLWMELVAA